MSHTDNLARRLQYTLQLLKANPEGLYNKMRPDGIFHRVIDEVPLNDYEDQILPSGIRRGNVNLSYGSHDLVGAGWLDKAADGSGLWTITEEGLSALDEFPDPLELHKQAKARFKIWSANNKARKEELLRTIIVPRHGAEESVRSTAEEVKRRGLQTAGSVFSPDRSVWTRHCVNELLSKYVSVTEVEGEDYLQKLQYQLRELSDDSKLLLAELTMWQLLPIAKTGMGGRKKADRIETILQSMNSPVQIPEEILTTLKDGVFHPGMGMIGQPHSATSMAVRLVDNWLNLDADQQAEALDNPNAWRNFILGWMEKAFPTQRNSFLYIVHPEYFTSIVPDTDKRAIRDAFGGEIGGVHEDIDRDLFEITLRLQQKAGGPVEFYSLKYEKYWKPSPSMNDEEGTESAKENLPTRVPAFPQADSTLSALTHIDTSWLDQQLKLLERRRQIIYYGPPGTGKTFIAMALANHVAGEEKYTDLVQFHPSYSYEDFFEGYRPVTTEGGLLTYVLKHGPLRRMVAQALENPEYNYVLVIDEINRGNLAKIFGELYFLLEYRSREIHLQYSEDTFELPENLFIIGTMNTADRSIALMDAAMRRRFAFIELHPDSAPVAQVLPTWLAAKGIGDEPAKLLQHLNSLIKDPAFRIGPSYFMPKDALLDNERLAQVWENDILPLLEEHHYGEGLDVHKRYGLSNLRLAMSQITGAPDQSAAHPKD